MVKQYIIMLGILGSVFSVSFPSFTIEDPQIEERSRLPTASLDESSGQGRSGGIIGVIGSRDSLFNTGHIHLHMYMFVSNVINKIGSGGSLAEESRVPLKLEGLPKVEQENDGVRVHTRMQGFYPDVLKICSAYYGTQGLTDKWLDPDGKERRGYQEVTNTLEKAFNGQKSGTTIHASNKVMGGDPSRTNPKTLEVYYWCIRRNVKVDNKSGEMDMEEQKSDPMYEEVKEGDWLSLSCANNEKKRFPFLQSR